VHVTTDWDLARHLVRWAPQLREMLGFTRVRKTLGLTAAVANLAGRAPEDDRPEVIAALTHHFGGEVSVLAVGKQR
jgi:hypothetical protein